MHPILLYFLRFSISLGFVWGFYQLLLRRLTFYNWNRWYLLGYSCLCLLIPLIDVGPVLDKGGSGEPLVVQFIPSVGARAVVPVSRPRGLDMGQVLLLLMGAGAVVFLVRLVVRWMSLRRVRRGARLIDEDGVKIYQVEGVITPFSFGNAIYINPRLHSDKEWADIILHEYVHIRQRHSVDILLAELLCILNWYNPFVWCIRYCIRQNLEFIADQKVLGSGVDRKGYQYHLLKVVGDPGYRLANNFNFSSLKKRIIMMNKIKSARVHLVKFLFILPLMGVLLVAFRNKVDGLLKGPVKVESVGGGNVAAGVRKTTVNRVAAAVDKDVAAARRELLAGLQRLHARVRMDVRADTAVPAGTVRHGVADLNEMAADHHRGADTLKKGVPGNVLFVVDGEIKPTGYLGDSLSPEKIYAISVIKNEDAVRYFGARGANGVVAITTKDFWVKHPELNGIKDAETRDKWKSIMDTSRRQLWKGLNLPAHPLYIVDGVEKTEKEAMDIDPNLIESVNVVKYPAGSAIYGDRGKNGVVVISLKKKTSYQPRMTMYGKDGPMSMRADSIITRVNGDKVVVTAEKTPGQ